ncbi:MAG: hypothetical protein EBS09_11800 [Flavobacteriia bacterium]|nr:hypothetical protein [Flavobacteriia bacterium]
MKQTAVEWLVEQLTLFETPKWVQEAIEQAKEMEKEQIIDAYETSHISMMTAEQYYNETFNKSINDKG